ncbi:MAG: hypothetical protein CME06_13835 [Gemmatimonadetes bacterium]|nr:hypothetical protein [Gemmatimonadota bacterium]
MRLVSARRAAAPPSIGEIRATLGILARQVLRAGLGLAELKGLLSRTLAREAAEMGMSTTDISQRLGITVRRVFDLKREAKLDDEIGSRAMSIASAYMDIRNFCGNPGRTFQEILECARAHAWRHGVTRRSLEVLLDAMLESDPPMLLRSEERGEPIFRAGASRTRFAEDPHQTLAARYLTLMRASAVNDLLPEEQRYVTSLYMPIQLAALPRLVEAMRTSIVPGVRHSLEGLGLAPGEETVHVVVYCAPVPGGRPE